MYELFDGVISIIGGIYCYLTAIGKVKLKKSEKDAIAWRLKYSGFLKLCALALFCFGVFRLYQYTQLS